MKKILSLIIVLFLIFFLFYRKTENKLLKFDKVFLINLEKSKERLTSSNFIFNKFNIKYEKYPAVDGKNLNFVDRYGNITQAKDIVDQKKSFLLHENYNVSCKDLNFTYKYNNAKKPFKEYKRSLTPGEIGCVCSHFSLAKKLLKSNDENYLIFEDDFVLPNNFNQKLNEILINIPKECEIIYLYHNKNGFNLHLNHFYSWILYGYNKDVDYVTKVVKSISGLVGYVLTKNGAKSIVEEVEKNGLVNLGADHYIARVLINKNKLKACIVRSKIVTWGQNGLHSTTGVFLKNDGTKMEFK